MESDLRQLQTVLELEGWFEIMSHSDISVYNLKPTHDEINIIKSLVEILKPFSVFSSQS